MGDSVGAGEAGHAAGAVPPAPAPDAATLLRALPAIVWSTDGALIVRTAAGAGLAGIGVADGEAIGLPLSAFLGTTDPDAAPVAAHRRALTGRMVRYLAEWRGRFYRVQVAPLRDAAGVVSGTVAVALETAAWPQGAPSTAGAAAAPRRSDGPVVLVVDDDVSVLNLVDRVLRDLGCRTLLAPDPELALRLVRESLPTLACLVVDITMPRIDGPTLAERLRAGRPDLPVLYLTGVPDAAPPGSAIVVKPFTPDALARAVSACLEAPAPSRAAGG